MNNKNQKPNSSWERSWLIEALRFIHLTWAAESSVSDSVPLQGGVHAAVQPCGGCGAAAGSHPVSRELGVWTFWRSSADQPRPDLMIWMFCFLNVFCLQPFSSTGPRLTFCHRTRALLCLVRLVDADTLEARLQIPRDKIQWDLDIYYRLYCFMYLFVHHFLVDKILFSFIIIDNNTFANPKQHNTVVKSHIIYDKEQNTHQHLFILASHILTFNKGTLSLPSR